MSLQMSGTPQPACTRGSGLNSSNGIVKEKFFTRGHHSADGSVLPLSLYGAEADCSINEGILVCP